MESLSSSNVSKPPPRIEPHVPPVNGIVQPPVLPPPGRPGRRTTALDSLKVVLNCVWKSRWSFHFRYPVDAVALNIPDYHTVIKRPMDLSTIKLRLNNNYYWQADEALEDFELIFENCMLYNMEGSVVNKAGKMLREAFYTQLSNIDLSNETEVVTPAPAVRKRKTEQMQLLPPPVIPAKRLATKQSVRKARQSVEPRAKSSPKTKRKSSSKPEAWPMPLYTPSATFLEPVGQLQPEDVLVPWISVEREAMPIKWDIQSKVLLEWQLYLVEKRHSQKLLRSLTKNKRLSINWPFKSCEIWRNYCQNLNYDHDKVEKLDWEILKMKLENNQFENFEAFVNKLQEMFGNAFHCFPFNPTVIKGVRELNEVMELRLDSLRRSIAEMKTRIRDLVDEKVQIYTAILSQHDKFISNVVFSYGRYGFPM